MPNEEEIDFGALVPSKAPQPSLSMARRDIVRSQGPPPEEEQQIEQ